MPSVQALAEPGGGARLVPEEVDVEVLRSLAGFFADLLLLDASVELVKGSDGAEPSSDVVVSHSLLGSPGDCVVVLEDAEGHFHSEDGLLYGLGLGY